MFINFATWNSILSLCPFAARPQSLMPFCILLLSGSCCCCCSSSCLKCFGSVDTFPPTHLATFAGLFVSARPIRICFRSFCLHVRQSDQWHALARYAKLLKWDAVRSSQSLVAAADVFGAQKLIRKVARRDGGSRHRSTIVRQTDSEFQFRLHPIQSNPIVVSTRNPWKSHL